MKDCINKVTQENKQIKMVALDFDLTIYDYAEPLTTLLLRDWFLRLNRSGILCGVASGRNWENLRDTLGDVGLAWQTPFPNFVIENDGQIWDGNGVVSQSLKDWNVLRRLHIQRLHSECLPAFTQAVNQLKDRKICAVTDIVCNPAGISIEYETPQVANVALEYVSKELLSFSDVSVSRNHHILLIVPRGFAKGDAVEKLAKIRGFMPSEVLAIGDNLNDLSMLCQERGFYCATVSNAEPMIKQVVKKSGGFISFNRVARGVCEIFAHYFGDMTQKPVDLGECFQSQQIKDVPTGQVELLK